MKYLKLFEDFDWEEIEDDFDEEKFDKDELTDCYIVPNNDSEAIEIVKKLKELGFRIYHYDEILKTGMDGWEKFSFDDFSKKWVRSSNSDIPKNIIDYKIFMHTKWNLKADDIV